MTRIFFMVIKELWLNFKIESWSGDASWIVSKASEEFRKGEWAPGRIKGIGPELVMITAGEESTRTCNAVSYFFVQVQKVPEWKLKKRNKLLWRPSHSDWKSSRWFTRFHLIWRHNLSLTSTPPTLTLQHSHFIHTSLAMYQAHSYLWAFALTVSFTWNAFPLGLHCPGW